MELSKIVMCRMLRAEDKLKFILYILFIFKTYVHQSVKILEKTGKINIGR